MRRGRQSTAITRIIAAHNVRVRRVIVLARALLPVLSLGVALPGCSAAPATGCADQNTAQRIWSSLDQRLNAIALDPAHAGLEAVATGSALDKERLYIQERLVAQHLTEREVDRLDSLAVLDPGCGKGMLRVRVTVTLVQDDYLAADGHVDHADEAVGSTFHLIESFVRSGADWKEVDFVDADQPTPTPQLLAGRLLY